MLLVRQGVSSGGTCRRQLVVRGRHRYWWAPAISVAAAALGD